jgi:hypothetical protein
MSILQQMWGEYYLPTFPNPLYQYLRRKQTLPGIYLQAYHIIIARLHPHCDDILNSQPSVSTGELAASTTDTSSFRFNSGFLNILPSASLSASQPSPPQSSPTDYRHLQHIFRKKKHPRLI